MMRRIAVDHMTETAKAALRGIAASGADSETREALARAVIGEFSKGQMPASARLIVATYWEGLKA